MKIAAIANWFGSNRESAQRAGLELGKLDWCGVPFVGGAPELPFIRTRAGLASDLHRHLINLCRVVRDDALCAQLADRLGGMVLHPDEMAWAQRTCVDRGEVAAGLAVAPDPDVEWAAAYFCCSWMGRGGGSGKSREFRQNLSYRWTASGGGSAKRFDSAVASLKAWHAAFRGTWDFVRMNAFDFLSDVKDERGHGLYIDAPWPDAGDEYEHRFTEEQQRALAQCLSRFSKCRVVVRYGDHPLIRELYKDGWSWIDFTTRNQKNNLVIESLIVNGRPYGC